MKRDNKTLFLLLMWFSLVAIACNVASSPPPPTLIPRAPSEAPAMATLGYATPEQGADPGIGVAAESQIEPQLALYGLLDQVDTDRMMIHIDTLVNFHTRHVNSPTNRLDYGVGAAFNYIMDQFQAIQAQAPENFVIFPEGHEFNATFNGITSKQRNAVAVLMGTDEGAGTLVVGAHYDSRADNLDEADAFAPGAADNGSGVAAVLEIARILSRHPQKATIIFVLFAAEEVGRQGSIAFVEDYIKRHDIPLIGMINIDTIGNWRSADGTINDRDIRIFSAGPNESFSRQLARGVNFIGYNHGLDLNMTVFDQLDREGRYGDHQSFSDAGYPAIRYIESLENTNKRESRDTIDGIAPLYLHNATRTILGTVTSLAGGPRAPRNISFRPAGENQHSLVWEPVPEAAQYIVALRSPDSLIYNQQFTVNEPRTAAWTEWNKYAAIAVAAIGQDGLVGPLSTEIVPPR